MFMSQNVSRNAPCTCGSGKKYKLCCMNKDIEEKKNTIKKDIVIFETLKFGIMSTKSCADQVSNIQISNIYRKQNILVLEFEPFSVDTMGMKTECAQVMQFAINLLSDEFSPENLNIDNITVRGLNKKKQELMYVSSSIQTATFLKENRIVEWLKFSIFNDNSEETILSHSKIKISRIEIGLRNIIKKILADAYGEDWWNQLSKKNRDDAEHTYKIKYRDEDIPKGHILIDYTYLLGLKKIILNNWELFKHVFKERTIFEKHIDQLNVIRREESHNRIISPDDFVALSKIYKELATQLELVVPGVVPKFLIENWREEVKKIINEISEKMEDVDEEDKRDIDKMNNVLNQHRMLYLDGIEKLNNVIIPVSKEQLTEQLKMCFKKSADALYQMIGGCKIMNSEAVDDASKKYEKCMQEVNEFEKYYLLSEQ